jgi:hypothetical protein
MTRFCFRTLAACAIGAIGVSCGRGPAPPQADTSNAGPPWFEEVAEAAGIRFVHQSGHRDKFLLPEIMGGGAALFDMDNDGFLDLYLVQSGHLSAPVDKQPGNRLYRNRGDGRFEDVTAGSGAEIAGYGMGVAAGDYDNDGNVDLYVTNLGGNVLLKGDGHGHFIDVTAKAGVAEFWMEHERRVSRLRRRWRTRSLCRALPELAGVRRSRVLQPHRRA